LGKLRSDEVQADDLGAEGDSKSGRSSRGEMKRCTKRKKTASDERKT